MEVSAFPPFPTPEPPAIVTQPAGRGQTMLLQALFLLAFWSGLYILHEQATVMVAAERKALEREQVAREKEEAIQRIAGRWVSANRDDAIIFFGLISSGKEIFGFRRDNVWTWSGFWTDGKTYFVQIRDKGEDIRGRIEGGELVIEFGEIGEQYFEKHGLPWNGVWRFRRR